MEHYKELFIDFLTDSNALKLSNPNDPEGLFTLKSGRRSPFFMNIGDLNDGYQLNIIGTAYAEAIYEHFANDFDVIFGPAYKGIPLAISATMAFHTCYDDRVRFCTNRKEAKDHGDVGRFLGSRPKDGDRIVIVEDVTTTGSSIDDTMKILRETADVEIVGLVVSVDRMEISEEGSTRTALETLSEKYGFEAHAIVTMAEVLERKKLPEEQRRAFRNYYNQYGVPGRKVI